FNARGLANNSVVMMTFHISDGPSHSGNNVPHIIWGNGGGFLKTGQYIDPGKVTSNKMQNTLITAAIRDKSTAAVNFGTGSGSGGSAGGRGGTGGGTAGTTGSGGSVVIGAPKPSAGCGKAGRPSGGMVQVANTSLYMFPTSYDGTKPFPLLIALHACGNPNTEFVSLTNNTGFATDYVRSYPNTPDSGQCWNSYTGDVARIIQQYDEVMNNYCIDQN